MATTAQQHFVQQRNWVNGYFEVSYFASNSSFSHERNALGRLRNNLVFAMNTKKMLPKMLVVILEDDVIKYLEAQTRFEEKQGAQGLCGLLEA